MKCPQCSIDNGQTSRVYPLGSTSTAMAVQRYYDEDGEYHNHNPNQCAASYVCSKGHRWFVDLPNPCPAPGCDYHHC